jgi:hypothetical protein
MPARMGHGITGMSRIKSERSGGRGAAIEDAGQIRDAFGILHATGTEFPIKVEGTSTLPYASVVKQLDIEHGTCSLKLVRPLPHELLIGAEFRMVFPVENQRYEALVLFQGRKEYLTYQFSLPNVLFYADRRSDKRFPFRPRESAYVTAQDGGIPGLGVAGPLVNICSAGLAMRIDRVLKLDDGIRIPPSTALFDRDKHFTRIRIQDLPKVPLLEVQGFVAHATERGTELILGFAFDDMKESDLAALGECLSFREKMLRGSAAARDGSAPISRGLSAPRTATTEKYEDEPQFAESANIGLNSISLMSRRTKRVVLAMEDNSKREELIAIIRGNGFHRLEVVSSMEEIGDRWNEGTGSALLLVDLAIASVEFPEPLAAMRAIERQLQPLGDIPTLILCEQVDPTLHMATAHNTRILTMFPQGPQEEVGWLDAIEHMAGLQD